ncbi:hypothetical protein BDR26DRAFT_892687 [Obelidium mucronatum]|nr:hypothetical protein BDR26DRAFT_892687 [Obelidium mucronatum]
MVFEQSLATLQECIENDVFLHDANLEPHIVAKSLAFHQNDVSQTLKALTNHAKWYKEVLGHQSKRVSIVHVHAFLLTGVFTILPYTKGPDGRPILLFRGAKDTRAIPKQHHAIFTMWHHLWMLRDNADGNHHLFVDFQGYKFKHFRPSEYKLINEAVACEPAPPTNSTFYALNANKTAVRLWDAIRRIIKDIPYTTSHFIKSKELGTLMDVSKMPVDFGGLRSMQDTLADIKDFIRDEYVREGLRYEPIDVKSINWKTYKVPDVDLTVRPESAMSVASNVDFDQIDAQLEKLGLQDSEE